MRIFWDTNVILDLIDADRPDHLYAKSILKWSASKPIRHLCAWHTLSIVDYQVCKKFGRTDTNEILKQMLSVYSIPPTGTEQANEAFSYLNQDHEDAMQIAAAVLGKADCIITRDTPGFSNSPIAVMSPSQFLMNYAK